MTNRVWFEAKLSLSTAAIFLLMWCSPKSRASSPWRICCFTSRFKHNSSCSGLQKKAEVISVAMDLSETGRQAWTVGELDPISSRIFNGFLGTTQLTPCLEPTLGSRGYTHNIWITGKVQGTAIGYIYIYTVCMYIHKYQSLIHSDTCEVLLNCLYNAMYAMQNGSSWKMFCKF